MKGSIIALAIFSLFSVAGLASENKGTSQELSYSVMADSPQVCQFSLTSYSGIINNSGNTGSFQVGLSCPQTEDVRATVVVLINNEHVASKVVSIKAGKDYSNDVYINVGTGYYGERYKLVVQ
ncbi:MAG: hypothetical protein K2L97_08105 [Muribaculaceae bacterium]|nr:hypothetical protein [Muribaculaceae bacterium]